MSFGCHLATLELTFGTSELAFWTQGWVLGARLKIVDEGRVFRSPFGSIWNPFGAPFSGFFVSQIEAKIEVVFRRAKSRP